MHQNHFGKIEACNRNPFEDILVNNLVNKCKRTCFSTTLSTNVKEIAFQQLPTITICISNVIPEIEVEELSDIETV